MGSEIEEREQGFDGVHCYLCGEWFLPPEGVVVEPETLHPFAADYRELDDLKLCASCAKAVAFKYLEIVLEKEKETQRHATTQG